MREVFKVKFSYPVLYFAICHEVVTFILELKMQQNINIDLGKLHWFTSKSSLLIIEYSSIHKMRYYDTKNEKSEHWLTHSIA